MIVAFVCTFMHAACTQVQSGGAVGGRLTSEFRVANDHRFIFSRISFSNRIMFCF